MKSFFRGECHSVVLLAFILYSDRVLGQATGSDPYFLLENISSGAPISYADGRLAGPEIKAQLWFGELNSPVDLFTPLFPTTQIVSQPGLEGYFQGILVSLPAGLYYGGETISVQVRAFDGDSWESSAIRGESITLEKNLIPSWQGLPNRLTGLQPFSVHTVPEPSTWSLLIVGFVVTVTMTCRSRGSAGGRPG